MLEFPEIAVYNLHHNAGTTAETALALLFAAAKFVVPFDNDLRRHDWTRRYQPNPSLLLAGKTVLILGFGAIGQHVGRVCHALGMTVIGVRRRVGNLPELGFPAVVHPMADLLDLLGRTQVLVIALPGTPETDGLVDETALRALPRGAVLVNIGRGAVVDSGAMYRALVDGHLRAAGLDVWYHYPDSAESRTHTPPADFPFHELDNVVLSPHRGGATEETESLRMQALAEMLNAAAEGRPLPGRVDVRAGY
jgi:phosphoglycerate dehydrogenase-like enzyme